MIDSLKAAEQEVIHLSRRKPDEAAKWLEYDLRMPASSIDLGGADAVVHCAYDMKAKGANHLALNGFAAAQLAAKALSLGVPILNISSVLAARPELSWYARTKHSVEVSVNTCGGVNLRLGVLTDFAVDPFAAGVAKLIERTHSRLLPVPTGWVWQASLHQLRQTVVDCLQNSTRGETIWLARDHSVSLRHHVLQICEYFGYRVKLFEVPLPLLRIPLWTLDQFNHSRSTFSMDALEGLRMHQV